MIARILAHLKSWLGHGEPRTPQALDDLCRALSEQVKRKGPGSDLAAAKLQGVKIATLVMRPAPSAWRGSR